MINEKVKKIMNILLKKGYSCYVVGGAVRNSLLSMPVTDYDLTTSAEPNEIINSFEDFQIYTVGIKHGTVIVVSDNEHFEVTTMRKDGEYSDYRRPDTVTFTNDLKTDLGRRDFTVNAMAFSLEGELYDYFNGKNDLINKIIRCVGIPDKRFREDPLRILRALRFAAEYGFDIEPKTRKALFENSLLLNKISPERIRDEFKKLVSAEYGGEIINEYYKIIGEFIPEIKSCKNFDQKSKYHKYDVLTHICHTMKEVKGDTDLSFAMFFHDMGKPFSYTEENGVRHFKGHGDYSTEIAVRAMKKLRFDNETIEKISFLVKYHDYPITAEQLNPKGIRRLLSKFGMEGLKLLSLVHKADDTAKADFVKDRLYIYDKAVSLALEMTKSEECYTLKTLAVNGNDIIGKGFCGKNVGIILKKLLNEVIEGNLPNNKDILLKYIDINSKMW